MALIFIIVIGLAFLGAYAQGKFEKILSFSKSLIATLLAVSLGVGLFMFLPLVGMLHADKNHLKFAQESVENVYGLDLLPKTPNGKPVFDFINGHGTSVWEVQVSNDYETYNMNLRFDEKSGQAVLSFPDKFGVPSPKLK